MLFEKIITVQDPKQSKSNRVPVGCSYRSWRLSSYHNYKTCYSRISLVNSNYHPIITFSIWCHWRWKAEPIPS